MKVRKLAFACVIMTLLPAQMLAAAAAGAATVVGVLVGGGGSDDMRVDVRDAKGRVVSAYCLEACGDIFGDPDADEVVRLKPGYRKRKVKLDYFREMNKGRIAGPGEEKLEFVKKLEILR